MKVVIIGSGNVATVLGKKILAAGYEIAQVVSRSYNHAQALASHLNTTAAEIKHVTKEADLYLLCVADNAIMEVSSALPFNDKLVAHTAGAVSIHALSIHKNHGVLYPLQSLQKQMKEASEIPMLVDGSSPDVVQRLFDFTTSWASSVSFSKDDDRLKLHLAAVFASNFTNHIYTLTEDFCKKENIDFRQLLPLIKETSLRVDQGSPSTLQTGPAVRNDTVTMKKHLKVLEAHKELKELYTSLSKSIIKHHQKK